VMMRPGGLAPSMVSGLVEAVSMNPSLTTKKGKVEMDSGVCAAASILAGRQ
jgi:hypothetical protein